MAPHSSTLAWKIPWMEEPGRLQSMGSLSVRHDWVTSHSLFTVMHWRRKWQPTPVFLPGEPQGRRSLVGCHLWGCIELDTTDVTQQQQQLWDGEGQGGLACCSPWGRKESDTTEQLNNVLENWWDIPARSLRMFNSNLKNLPFPYLPNLTKQF